MFKDQSFFLSLFLFSFVYFCLSLCRARRWIQIKLPSCDWEFRLISDGTADGKASESDWTFVRPRRRTRIRRRRRERGRKRAAVWKYLDISWFSTKSEKWKRVSCKSWIILNKKIKIITAWNRLKLYCFDFNKNTLIHNRRQQQRGKIIFRQQVKHKKITWTNFGVKRDDFCAETHFFAL